MNTVLLVLVAVLCVLVALSLFRKPTTHEVAEAPQPAPIDPEAFLAPVRELLGRIDDKVNGVRTDAAELRTSVTGQLTEIVRQNIEISRSHRELGETTATLRTALSGTGVRGSWGQVQLRRVVELAGLTRHVTYVEQSSVTGHEGRLTPDMLVKLPDGKTIVVDSKSPGLDVDGSADFAKKLVRALRDRVKELSSKEYARFVDGSIDFTILFVPSEGTLATALNEDPGLSEDAIQQNVLIATPLTLLAMLRAVEYGWKQNDQAENASVIALEAAELLDRITTFADHYNKVGSELQQLLKAYNDSIGSAQDRLIPQAKKVKALGVATKKTFTEPSPVDGSTKSIEIR